MGGTRALGVVSALGTKEVLSVPAVEGSDFTLQDPPWQSVGKRGASCRRSEVQGAGAGGQCEEGGALTVHITPYSTDLPGRAVCFLQPPH